MRIRVSSPLLVALVIAACGGGGGTTVTPPPPPPGATVDHVVIDNGSFELQVGDTRQLQVRPLSATGALVTDVGVSYATSTAVVATVGGSGLVTAFSVGTTTITATSGGKSATITVTVTQPPVASFTAQIVRPTISTNDTTRVIATLRDINGNILTGRTITWTSSDQSIAVVGPIGLILGIKVGGPVTITGTVEGKSATVNVVIIPSPIAVVHVLPDSATIAPGSTAQFTVEAIDLFGGVVQDPEVIWGTVAGQIASVSPTGLVTGVQAGDALILATVNGVTGQALVHIAFPDLAKFGISLDNRLKYPVNITENDVIVGQAPPNSITVVQRPVTEHARIGWAMVRPNGIGEPVGEEMPDMQNPTGTIAMIATNVLSDGRTFFTPEVRDLAGAKVLLNFPVRDLAINCTCAASPLESISRDYGYWKLTSQTVMQVYRADDLSLTGVHLTIPVPIGDVDAKGVWRFNLLIGP